MKRLLQSCRCNLQKALCGLSNGQYSSTKTNLIYSVVLELIVACFDRSTSSNLSNGIDNLEWQDFKILLVVTSFVNNIIIKQSQPKETLKARLSKNFKSPFPPPPLVSLLIVYLLLFFCVFRTLQLLTCTVVEYQ